MDIWTYQSVEYVTVAGEAWLASASEYPRSMRALWESRPWAPTVLPCGRAFDVISMPSLFGRRLLDELWSAGPGCGPVASYRGRTLLFCKPGTAQRLRTLLAWEEWAGEVPPLLCHGEGDAVTVPPVQRMIDAPDSPGLGVGRWIVAPDTKEPWLPSAPMLLRAARRAAQSTAQSTTQSTAQSTAPSTGPSTGPSTAHGHGPTHGPARNRTGEPLAASGGPSGRHRDTRPPTPTQTRAPVAPRPGHLYPLPLPSA